MNAAFILTGKKIKCMYFADENENEQKQKEHLKAIENRLLNTFSFSSLTL